MLRFLVTTPRVAAGLLSWQAWQTIASADEVLASSDSAPLVRAVRATGRQVGVLPSPDAGTLLRAASGADVVWLASDEESTSLPGGLATELVAGEAGAHGPGVEVLHGSYDVPGARLLDLVSVMDRLRRECPWDQKQTHRTLAKYLLEESYETLEAIESGDPEHLREELGDLLLQVYFHARIAAEDTGGDAFTIDDVAGGIVDKLVHRHPHVFAGLEVSGAGEVEANWESLKAAEKQRGSVLDGIPWALPALALADKVVGRAGRLSSAADPSPADPPPADPPPADPPPADPSRSRPGNPSTRQPASAPSPEDRIGEMLLELVGRARSEGVDPEQALRDAVRRLAERVREQESGAQ